jgi:hypothetical protein
MTEPFRLCESPKYSWRLVIGHSAECGISIMYTDEHAPNWFHRKMQELILGFKWQKLNT